MAQFDFGVMDPDAISGAELADILNDWRDAMYSMHRGTSRPSYAIAGFTYLNTSATPYAITYYDGSQDIIIGYIDESSHNYMTIIGGGTGTIASGATTDLGSVRASHLTVNGSATISSFGTSMRPGTLKTIVFAGGATVVHSPNLDLPTAANVVTNAGDRMLVVCIASGVHYVMNYTPAASSTDEPIGIVKEFHGLDLPAGYLYADGSAVSRTTYANLFTKLTRQTTGDTTSGSATITNVGSTSKIAVGMPISGPGIPANSLVRSFVTNTSITMGKADGSASNATATATGVAIVIAPHGVGDGSTTFNVPNRAGTKGVGRENMSGAARGLHQITTNMTTTNGGTTGTVASASGLFVGMYISSPNVPINAQITAINGTTISFSPNGTGVTAGTNVSTRFSPTQDAQRLGAFGGAISQTQNPNELPAHGHNVSISQSPHTHDTTVFYRGYSTSGAALAYNNGGPDGSLNITSSSNSISISASATNTGGGLPHNNTDPSTVCDYIIKF